MTHKGLKRLVGLCVLGLALFSSPGLQADRPLPSWLEYRSSVSLRQGVLHWSQGNLDAAEAAWSEAVRFSPNNGAALLLLTAVHVKRGRWQQAAASSVKLDASNEQSIDVDLLAARIAVELGHFDEARVRYQRALERFPSDLRGELGLALVAARGPRDWPEMAARLAAARALRPEFNAAMLPQNPGWNVLADDEEFLQQLRVILGLP